MGTAGRPWWVRARAPAGPCGAVLRRTRPFRRSLHGIRRRRRRAALAALQSGHFQPIPFGPIPPRSSPPRPIPLRPIPLRPIPPRPIPLRPIPLRPIPLRPIPLRPIPLRPCFSQLVILDALMRLVQQTAQTCAHYALLCGAGQPDPRRGLGVLRDVPAQVAVRRSLSHPRLAA
jgi:hypothetical protein